MKNGLIEIPVAKIVVGQRFRKTTGDVGSLAASIEKNGLLHPILVDGRRNLVCGQRRLEAVRQLGRKSILARVVDLRVDKTLAEHDENECREPFKPSERAAIYRAILSQEKAAARERQRESGKCTGRGRKKGCGQVTHNLSESNKSRERAAKKTGKSRKTVEAELKVLEIAEGDRGRYGDLVEIMDSKGRAAPALREYKRRENAASHKKKSKSETQTFSALGDLLKAGDKFGTIYADPPWPYDNQATRSSTDNHYSTMSIDDICALPIGDLAAKNCHLHLWTTNGFLFDAKRVMDAWGFTYKSCFVWVKPQMGIGNYWRVSHEFLLLGVRGKCSFESKSLKSWAEIERGKHSAKPDAVRKMIEKASPGPRLELFARKESDGWTVWGNEVETFSLLEK